MHTHRKRIMFYSFFLLFLMACRTWGCSTPQNVKTADNTDGSIYFSCQSFIQLSADPHAEGNVCTLTCPTGLYTFDLYDKEPLDFFTMTIPQVQAQYCPGGAASNSTAPTEEPAATEEPAPTEPPAEPAPLKPFLTGAFTTCDNAAGYVNFTIADDAPAYDPATFKVTFNNYPVSCAPAANNPKVFTCKYPPASYAPPAGVQVIIGEEIVNEFDFNGGSICDPAPQPNNSGNTGEGEQAPAATEPPSD